MPILKHKPATPAVCELGIPPDAKIKRGLNLPVNNIATKGFNTCANTTEITKDQNGYIESNINNLSISITHFFDTLLNRVIITL